jgi:hypothetical protein
MQIVDEIYEYIVHSVQISLLAAKYTRDGIKAKDNAIQLGSAEHDGAYKHNQSSLICKLLDFVAFK